MKTKEEIYAAIRKVGRDGKMPTIKLWNKMKPEGYPSYEWIALHVSSWGNIADELELTLQSKRYNAHKEEQKRERLALDKMREAESERRKPRRKEPPTFNNPDFFEWRHEPWKTVRS